MKGHPIMFSEPMILALLAGRKTQTRRLAWKPPSEDFLDEVAQVAGGVPHTITGKPSPWRRVQPGERLWVRETHKLIDRHCDYQVDWHKADRHFFAWRPAIHMPRWASRLTLTVTDVRVQRLQDMNRGDAMEEGCPFPNMAAGPNPRDWFRDLWNTLHGTNAWEANPEVVALTFTVHQRNIDA